MLVEAVDGRAAALREEKVGGELAPRRQEGLLVVDAGLDALERASALSKTFVIEGGVVNVIQKVVCQRVECALVAQVTQISADAESEGVVFVDEPEMPESLL